MATINPRRTLQGVSCESELTDDVARDVRLDALAFFSVSFSSLQKVVKLLRVKLLETEQETHFRSSSRCTDMKTRKATTPLASCLKRKTHFNFYPLGGNEDECSKLDQHIIPFKVSLGEHVRKQM